VADAQHLQLQAVDVAALLQLALADAQHLQAATADVARSAVACWVARPSHVAAAVALLHHADVQLQLLNLPADAQHQQLIQVADVLQLPEPSPRRFGFLTS